jgi:hypothetical protein
MRRDSQLRAPRLFRHGGDRATPYRSPIGRGFPPTGLPRPLARQPTGSARSGARRLTDSSPRVVMPLARPRKDGPQLVGGRYVPGGVVRTLRSATADRHHGFTYALSFGRKGPATADLAKPPGSSLNCSDGGSLGVRGRPHDLRREQPGLALRELEGRAVADRKVRREAEMEKARHSWRASGARRGSARADRAVGGEQPDPAVRLGARSRSRPRAERIVTKGRPKQRGSG